MRRSQSRTKIGRVLVSPRLPTVMLGSIAALLVMSVLGLARAPTIREAERHRALLQHVEAMGGGVLAVDGRSGRIERAVALDNMRYGCPVTGDHPRPNNVAVGDEHVWVVTRDRVVRIDPTTGQVRNRASFTNGGRSVVFGDDPFALAECYDQTRIYSMTREGPAAAGVLARTVGDRANPTAFSPAIFYGLDRLWMAAGATYDNRRYPLLLEVGPDRLEVRGRTKILVNPSGNAVTFDDDSVWLTGPGGIVSHGTLVPGPRPRYPCPTRTGSPMGVAGSGSPIRVRHRPAER